MEKTQANNFWKTSIKYFCLTILGLASIFCEILLIIPVVSPTTAVKMFKNIGLGSAAVGVAERQYKKSNKIEDLYNLVLVCDEVESGEKLLKYSSDLLKRDDFNAFEQAFNRYALEHTSKDKLYLMASLKNYLCEIRIEYEYQKSSEKAFLEAVSCFEYEDINLFYFSKYIDCIIAQSNETKAQKTLQIAQTANAIVGGKTVLNLVKERYDNFKPTNLENAELLLLEQLWQTKKVEIILLEATNDLGLVAAQSELENISTAIEAKLNND